MDALEAILTRRSTRDFAPEAVSDRQLDAVLQAGRQAPSGGNSQYNHFLVIRNRSVLDRLIRLTQEAFSKMETYEGMYPSLLHSIEASKRGGYRFCYNAPALIALANRRDYGNNVADCTCALENMMIAANALDLGSCYINQLRWLNEDEGLLKYLQTLGLKENERVYGALALGHPATPDGLPRRQPTFITGNTVTYI